MRLFLRIIVVLTSFCAASGCTEGAETGTSSHKTIVETEGKPFQIVTVSDRSKALEKSSLVIAQSASSGNVLVLDKSKPYQEIDGFGAAVTGSTCYNLLRMSKEDRTAFLKKTFSVDEGFGMSYIRISIGCSDFSLSEYTCCDAKGIENFALTDEEIHYVIPVLKEIMAINPGIKIMGSPWTCPRWMKVHSLDNRTEYPRFK